MNFNTAILTVKDHHIIEKSRTVTDTLENYIPFLL